MINLCWCRASMVIIMKRIVAFAMLWLVILGTVSFACASDDNALKVGSIYKFGHYEQDGNTANGKEAIEWVVAASESGWAFLVSKYGIDCIPYANGYKPTTWEESNLNKWLNGTFYNSAFTAAEKNAICLDEYTNHYVCIPTIGDAYALADISTEYLLAEPTTYAVSHGSLRNYTTGKCWWYVISPSEYYTYYVTHDCQMRFVKYTGNREDISVRPAIILDLTALSSN